MRRLGAAVTLALVWAVSVGAQATPSNPPDTPPQSNPPVSGSRDSLSLPKGTGIVGILSTNLDTKHSKVGDRVEVEVTQDVNRGGDILLRRGSHITGHVTLAYAFSKGDSTALRKCFQRLVAENDAVGAAAEGVNDEVAFARCQQHHRTRFCVQLFGWRGRAGVGNYGCDCVGLCSAAKCGA